MQNALGLLGNQALMFAITVALVVFTARADSRKGRVER